MQAMTECSTLFDAKFWLFGAVTWVVSAFGFLLFAIPLTLFAMQERSVWWAHKLQSRGGNGHEMIVPAVRSWAINNGLLAVVIVLSWPLLRLTRVRIDGAPSFGEFVSQLVLFLYLDDFLYYWVHRAMHTRWLYKKIHSVHHRIMSPWAITGHFMHPVEYVVTGTLALAGPILLGSHVIVVWTWILWRQWEAAEGHCGYDFVFSPSRWLPGSDGAVHHDAHHAKVKGNYAGFFPIWDKILGTFVKNYEEQQTEFRKRFH